ncbi:MAG: PQQ-binding-like beta-propeller repeat protein [Chloracidobacterium sp.]|nr:PQQ-binding-like beta-propeller repeat protein [Chloracidobacterium sp.]
MLKSLFRYVDGKEMVMLRKALPKILVVITLCLTAFGQTKPAGEVDIAKCWAYPLSDNTASTLAADAANVYIGSSGAKVEALSLDGKKLWATEFGGDINSNLMPTDAGLFLVTATVSDDAAKSGSVLRVVSKETGITSWTAKLPTAERHFLELYQGSIIVVSGNGVVQSLDIKDGTVKWKREIAEGFAGEPRFGGDAVVVGSTAKQAFTIMLATGEILSLRKIEAGVTSVGRVSTGDVTVGDGLGNVSLFLGGSEKPSWKFRSGGAISKILAANGNLFVTSHDNFAYSLYTSNGSLAWKRRLSGRVSHLSLINDKYIIVSAVDDHSVVLIELVKGKVAGQIALGADETLTADPVMSGGLILTVTDTAIYAHSLSPCPKQ